MKSRPLRHSVLGAVAAIIGGLILTGCEYEIPIASLPSRPVEVKLTGNWLSVDGKDTLRVRQLDDITYVISYNQELYSAQHHDVAGTPFVSVLHLDPTNRKYAFLTWSLSDRDSRLRLRVVSSKVIPKDTRDQRTMPELLRRHLGTLGFFGFEQDYVRQK